jgi:hypothetical protein
MNIRAANVAQHSNWSRSTPRTRRKTRAFNPPTLRFEVWCLVTEKNAFIPTTAGFGGFDVYERYSTQDRRGVETPLWLGCGELLDDKLQAFKFLFSATTWTCKYLKRQV